MTAAEFEEAKQRTAEADASGEWCTLADVQKHLLHCNPLFANPAHKNLSQWLSVHPLGRGIRRLFDKATESCPAGWFALQRYWLDDVVKVAQTYTTRVKEWRFETVDAPPDHTWLSFIEISRLTGAPRQRLLDLALAGYLQAVMVPTERAEKRGRYQRNACYTCFAAAREVLAWRPVYFTVRAMGRQWTKDRLAWQAKYGLQPPQACPGQEVTRATLSVYAPELIARKR